MKMKFIIICSLLLFIIACSPEERESSNAEYLGLETPTSTPQVFAPDIVSNGMYQRDLTITPDGKEIFYCSISGQYDYTFILHIKKENGKWSDPQMAQFSGNVNHKDLEPFVSPDGKKLYFASKRPLPGEDIKQGDANIWVVDKVNGKWGKPYPIGDSVNTDAPEFFPAVTKEGTLYFTKDDLKNNTSFIYRSKLVNGKYSKPEKLPKSVNTTNYQYNSYISPDESFMILPIYGREDSYGATDYYILFRNEKDQWSDPFNLGDKINSESGLEYSPYISPDSKYFFFMSAKNEMDNYSGKISYEMLNSVHNKAENGNPSIFWCNTDFLDKIKENENLNYK